MRTIFRKDEPTLIAHAINVIGAAVDITKYQGRLKYVQLTLAEGEQDRHVIARVAPPVSGAYIEAVMP